MNSLHLAVLFLLNSILSAFLMVLLIFSYATNGQIPFFKDRDLAYPYFNPKTREAKKAKPEVPEDMPATLERVSEDYLKSFCDELELKQEKIAAKQKIIAGEKNEVNKSMQSAKIIQKDAEDSVKKVKNILVKIDKKEIDNIKNLSKLVSSMDANASEKILLALDDRMACRVLRYMEQKSAALLISQILGTADKKTVRRVKKLTEDMYKLNEGEIK